jgi:ATP-binding protein involved in chromosome partitioning
MTTLEHIRERLSEIRAPGMPRDIVAAGMVRGVEFTNGTVTIQFQAVPMPAPSLQATLAEIRRAVGALPGVRGVDVQSGASPAGDVGSLPGVRDILAVSSTKGGVGKSTVAANLTLALARLGRRVGLLDADVYGPSLPMMFGLSGRPAVSDQNRVTPLERYGVRVMSIGFFLDESSPVIWRGPMVMGLVRQFLKDVDWGALDVLVVDMPPGTGDAQLTLVQQVPLAGAVVVTTPQEVATLDVQRGIAMFAKVNTPVLGVIENMSYYHCPRCGRDDEVFGHGGGERITRTFGLPLLGRLPLVLEVRQAGDCGTPLVQEQPDHPVSREFLRIATRVLEAVETERALGATPTIIG